MANPGDVCVVNLPENSLVDLDTFTMNFLDSTIAATGATLAGCLFPRNSESPIDTISVEINGVSVQNAIQRYNQIFKSITDYTMGDKQQQRSFFQNSVNIPSTVLTVAALISNFYRIFSL
jgi:hypothetical protein